MKCHNRLKYNYAKGPYKSGKQATLSYLREKSELILAITELKQATDLANGTTCHMLTNQACHYLIIRSGAKPIILTNWSKQDYSFYGDN